MTTNAFPDPRPVAARSLKRSIDGAHKTKSNAGVFRPTTPGARRQGFAAGLPGPGLQFRMFAEHALGPIKRDSSAEAVHLMHADVGREPAENSRQLVVRAAVKRCVLQVPGRYLGPKGILDLVQCRRAKRRWMPLVSMVLSQDHKPPRINPTGGIRCRTKNR